MAGGLVVRHADSEQWESAERFGFPPGVECLVFHEAEELDGVITVIGRMTPGFVEPAHTHEDVDHWGVIVAGEMHVDGDVLRPGDYLYAPAGVEHGPFSYPVGCTIFTTVRGRSFDHDFAEPS